MTKQQYNKSICGFKNRSDLLFFLLNILLSIKYSEYLYCQRSRRECHICSICTIFVTLKMKFWQHVQYRIFKEVSNQTLPLSKLFYKQKSSICCFLNSAFSHTISHWSGQIESILSDIIKKNEENILREEIRRPSLISHAEENS